jgi:hypothetical protein
LFTLVDAFTELGGFYGEAADVIDRFLLSFAGLQVLRLSLPGNHEMISVRRIPQRHSTIRHCALLLGDSEFQYLDAVIAHCPLIEDMTFRSPNASRPFRETGNPIEFETEMRALAAKVIQLLNLRNLMLSFPPYLNIRSGRKSNEEIYMRTATRIHQYMREAWSGHLYSPLPLPTVSLEMRYLKVLDSREALVGAYTGQRMSGQQEKATASFAEDENTQDEDEAQAENEEKALVAVRKGKGTGRKRKNKSSSAAEDGKRKRKRKRNAPDDEWLPEHHGQGSSCRNTKKKR